MHVCSDTTQNGHTRNVQLPKRTQHVHEGEPRLPQEQAPVLLQRACENAAQRRPRPALQRRRPWAGGERVT